MRFLEVLAAAMLALCAAAAYPAGIDPPAVVGRLNYTSGPVSFARAQANEDWSAAVLNRPLTTGDRLWTDANGRAEMHVGSLAIRMDAQTSLDVLALDEHALRLRLARGSANLRVRQLAGDEVLEVATPNGAVVVRQPGSFRVSVDPSGATTLVVVRAGGQAEIFAGNASFIVGDNQQASVAGSRQDLYAAPAADQFDQWAAVRDQREDRVASTRYVPEAMTGYEDLDQYGSWRNVPDYGAVWVPASVPSGWAPYQTGHWVWISPWGWTWVDSAPWGFAPFHYGRWVWLGTHWAWAPGRRIARPVYAPALVAFVGGPNGSLSVGTGPAVGWVPLGWREPYRPWYRASDAHLRNVNVTHVANVTHITNHVTNVRLVNRNVPSAVTVVSRENFVAARRADRTALRVNATTLAAAPVTRGAPFVAPAGTSPAAGHSASPPAAPRTRETVAVTTPPGRAQPAPQPSSADRGNRTAEDQARPQRQPNQQAERRAPAPPPEGSRRPTVDREARPEQDDRQRAQPQQAQQLEQQRRGQSQPQQAQAYAQQARQRAMPQQRGQRQDEAAEPRRPQSQAAVPAERRAPVQQRAEPARERAAERPRRGDRD